jgi:hypothetical protein
MVYFPSLGSWRGMIQPRLHFTPPNADPVRMQPAAQADRQRSRATHIPGCRPSPTTTAGTLHLAWTDGKRARRAADRKEILSVKRADRNVLVGHERRNLIHRAGFAITKAEQNSKSP